MSNWKEVRKELSITPEEDTLIELEKDLIRTMVSIREAQGLSQTDLADKCNVKQPVIARMEKAVHSPQINSLLKILVPLGYRLQIVPLGKNVPLNGERLIIQKPFRHKLLEERTMESGGSLVSDEPKADSGDPAGQEV